MTEETQVPIKQLPKVHILKKVKVVPNHELLQCIKNSLNKEDILYESKPGDFLNLPNNTKVKLLNKLNKITNSSVTVATMNERGFIVEKTSENVARLIGQSNYDTLFSALCSVFSQELKIRGILSLLTVPKKNTTVSVQTEVSPTELFKKEKPKRGRFRRLSPYVVTENSKQKLKINKVVIDPNNFQGFGRKSVEPEPNKVVELPLSMQDENSQESLSLSVNTWEPLIHDPMGLINKIQNVTMPPQQQVDWATGTQLTLSDGTVIKFPMKIEDQFHIVTPETIKYIPQELRTKVLWYQADIDWNFCLNRDDKNDLPIHVAAMNGDVGMLRRQCVVLKARQESVDVMAGENMTALQIAIYTDHPKCTTLLLHFGADPLMCDDEYRNCFHMAAENSPEHLAALINHCKINPLKVLQDNEELWTEDLATQPKEYLSKYLLRKISTMFDNQGYTPLMRASIEGRYENVKALLEAVPETVNAQMPNCGNTALYAAVSAACQDCTNRGNKSVVADNFRKTIELLVEYGADPAIDNHSGVSVNTLLTDFKVADLSMIVANKMTSKNCSDNIPGVSEKYDNFIFIKDINGSLNIKEIDKVKPKNEDTKPIILENIKLEFNKTPHSPLKPVKKEIVEVTTQDVAETKPTPNMYMNSFKNFVENRLNDKPDSENTNKTKNVRLRSKLSQIRAKVLKVTHVNANASKAADVTSDSHDALITASYMEVDPTAPSPHIKKAISKNINQSKDTSKASVTSEADANTSKLDGVASSSYHMKKIISVIPVESTASIPHDAKAVVKNMIASKAAQKSCKAGNSNAKIAKSIQIKVLNKPVTANIIQRKRTSIATVSDTDAASIESRTLKKSKLLP